MKLYLDLDGVFADLDAHLKSFGVDRNEQYHMPMEQWTKEHIERDKKIRFLMDEPGFFANIPLTADAEILWEYVERFNPVFLTALPRSVGHQDKIRSDKINYVRNKISKKVPIIVCLRSEKKEYSGPGNVLVDDLDMNIDEWNSRGGHGIYHQDAFTTIRKLDHVMSEVGIYG